MHQGLSHAGSWKKRIPKLGVWLKGAARKKWVKASFLTLSVLGLSILLIPTARFEDPYSTVLLDQDGHLLGAAVASDEQWRFSPSTGLPDKYVKALLTYEDRYFYHHPGINVVSLAKALYHNMRANKVISGGSTLTMQLARLARKNPPRTYIEKFWEMLIALKTELVCSKKQILQQYAAHAPFGSNVVGLEAACWRFFGSSSEQLSWGQAATLAVLPNAPALIFPGKNQQVLKDKRNGLLRTLWHRHIMDSTTCALAQLEPVPGPPKDLPQLAPELATRLVNAGIAGKRITTSLEIQLQQQVAAILERYHRLYRDNRIYNAAALVLDVRTGKTLAYIGNSADTSKTQGGQVDIITAPRSYGSLLKPLLYLASLEDGKICPSSLLPDYPANFGGFSPQNFNIDFDGVVPADQVLIRSLNIPSVFLLQGYSTPLFLDFLRKVGFTTFTQPASHYGLSLILGGGESNLWELTGAYAALAHRLVSRNDQPEFTESFLKEHQDVPTPLSSTYTVGKISRASLWTTFNVISNLYRPGDDGHWQQFSSSEKIAWKTGTSFGNRDGWAVGITPRYVVGVWVGNASGEGRSGLTGVSHAAPIMFDIFSLLPDGKWFTRPEAGWTSLAICRQSGFKASPACLDTLMETVPAACIPSPVCRFHQLLHLDPSGRYRVNSSCMNPADMMTKSWFVLSPVEEWYYRKNHSTYLPLPPMKGGCDPSIAADRVMSLVYPSDGAKIFIPKELEGERGKIVF